jgi:4a-hydroxytetrahydrobiopterin dehydratase
MAKATLCLAACTLAPAGGDRVDPACAQEQSEAMKANAFLSQADTAKRLRKTTFVHLDGGLHGSYRTANFASALALVNQVGAVAEALNHHPHVSLGWGRATFHLSSHDVGGVTERDLKLALRIQELAEAAGATPSELTPTRYDIAIDCTDVDAILPFWKVGLGYEELVGEEGTELVDPRAQGPRVWFQHMEIARTERNRIHLDVYVPTIDAADRVDAVIDAGGILLTDEHAPDWWVLADAEGNEMCICTTDN